MSRSRNNAAVPELFYLVALGCPKNLVDSEVIAGVLATSGYALTFEPEDADIFVINTCAFLPQARSEAAGVIEEACRWKAAAPEHRRIAVTGCLPEYDRRSHEYCEAFPQVDIWCRIDDMTKLPALLRGSAAGQPDGAASSYLYDENTPRLQLTMPHIGSVKIAEGCNNRCSYCSIPFIRGGLRSRSISSVAAEARQLIRGGVKELQILAQDITAFGHDTGESLAGLLRELDRLPGDFRMRLLYTHPAHYTPELIEVLATAEKVLPYLDMPLQHISDKILKSMNRHIGRSGIEKLIFDLRSAISGLTLRTTFITGLPGEGEAEFAELADFVRRTKFERMGVFAYSPEPGTPAAKMKDIPPFETAEERAKLLMTRQVARMKRANKKLIGTRQEVLVDFIDGDWAAGRSAMDAPEIDNLIWFPKDRRTGAGKYIQVEIVGTQGCDLTAEIVRK